MTDRTRTLIKHYGGALLLTLLALAARWLLDPFLGDHLPFVTFFVAVAVAAWLGGFKPALLAGVLGFLVAYYFFVPPRRELQAPTGPHLLGLAMYFMVALAFAAFGGALHVAQRWSEAGKELLRVTLASIGDAVITTDADGRVTFLNTMAEQLTGWSSEEAIGKPLSAVFQIVNEQTRQPVENPASKVLKTGQTVGLANHTVLIAKDGTQRPIDDSAAPIRHGSAKPLGVVLVFRDVSEKRQDEETRRRLAAIIESSDDAIVSKTLDGLITSWNAGAERVYGYSAAEIVGKPFSLLVPANRVDEVQESARRLQLGERLDHYETVRQRKDGSLIDVSVSYSPIRNDFGQVVGTAVITRDISDRKRAERRRTVRLAVTQILAEAADLEEACPRILQAVCEGLGWGVGALWAADAQCDSMRCVEFWHLPTSAFSQFEAATRQLSFGRGESLPGRVWATSKPLWMEDVARDERFVRRHVAAEEGLHGGFACPVYVEDKVLGVIEFFSAEIREPDLDLLELMATLGGQIGQFVDRKNTEQRLRQNEQELSDFFENASVGLHWVGPDGTIERVNRAELELLGYRRDEYVGRNIAEFHTDQLVIEDILQRLRSRETIHDYPARMRCKDGSIKEVLIDSSVQWKDGQFVHTRCFTRDVTERNRVYRQLAASERRFRTLTRHAPVGIFLTDPEGNCLLVNEHWSEMAGLTPEQVQGKGWISSLHPEDLDRVIGEWQAASQAGVEFESEYRFRTPQGKVTWLQGKASPLRDASGQIEGYVGTAMDITERRKVEQSFRMQAYVLESMAEGVSLFNADGVLLYANPAEERMFGFEPGQLTGESLTVQNAYPPEENQKIVSAIIQQLKTHGSWFGEFNNRKKDGTPFTTYARMTTLEAGGEQYFVCVQEDITERKQARVALEESEQRFRQLAEHITDVFWMADPFKREILYISPAYEQVWGVSCQSLYDQPLSFLEAIHPDDRERVVQSLERQAHGEATTLEYRVIRPDGTERWVWDRGFPVKEADGRVVRVAGIAEDITDRRKAEQALRESEERFRAAVDQAAVGVALVGLNHETLFVNRGLCEMLGYTEEEMLNGSFIDVTHPDDLAIDFEHIPLVLLAEANSCRYEKRYVHKDGSIVWGDLSVSAVRDEHGGLKYTVGVLLDITERKNVHEALRQSEERLRLALEGGHMGVWDWNLNTNELQWSESLEPMHGLAPGTFGGTVDAFQELVHPHDRAHVQRAIQTALEARSSFDVEFRTIWPDGSVHWIGGKGKVLTENDQPTRMVGIGMDVTVRKRSEDDARFLADASATFATVVDEHSTLQKVATLAVPRFGDWCAVDMVEADGRLRQLAVAHIDPAKVQLAHELNRRYPTDPQASVGAAHVARTGQSEMAHDITDELLAAVARDDEHLQILRALGLKSYLCVPMKSRGKILGVLTFVGAESGRRYSPSDLELAEELAGRAAVAVENARLYSELRDADRRKDEFLATLAHELRNPLAPIRNSLQILKMPITDRSIIDHSREMMERQVQHLVRLVDDLLDVSRVMRGKVELRKERVDVASIVARAIETAQPVIDAQGHELLVSIPSDPLEVEADPVRLAQVVSNLLNNAAKYTPPDGHIEVTVTRDGDQAVVRVRDDGIGISPEMLPKIFDLFVQVENSVSRSQGGLGIGLTLAKSLVEKHGGTIEAKSAGVKKGTELSVRLPLAPQRRLVHRPTGGNGDQPAAVETLKRRVLVVDDNVDAAESLAMLLHLNGNEARIAHDGATALGMAEEFAPDLIFLDLGMPVMDGYEVARRLRETPSTHQMFLVALTGWGQEEDRRRTKEAGFDLHLVKPVEPSALEEVLNHPKLPLSTHPRTGTQDNSGKNGGQNRSSDSKSPEKD